MEVDRQAFEVTVVHVCMSRFGGGEAGARDGQQSRVAMIPCIDRKREKRAHRLAARGMCCSSNPHHESRADL